MTRLMKTVALALAAILLSTFALAQNIATANLQGVIKDAKGGVVAGATVTVRDPARNFERTVKTNGQGEYIFTLLPPGDYTMTVESTGMAKMQLKDVVLTIGQTYTLPVEMKLKTESTEITVSAESELVEASKTVVSNTIDQTKIDNLPINERSYLSFALTA